MKSGKDYTKNLLVAAAIVSLSITIPSAYADQPTITPTRGDSAGYTWTNENNGQVSVTVDGTTYYTDIKQSSSTDKTLNYTYSEANHIMQVTDSATGNTFSTKPSKSGTNDYIDDFIGSTGYSLSGANLKVNGNGIGNSGAYGGVWYQSGGSVAEIIGDFIGNKATNMITADTYGGGALELGNGSNITVGSIIGDYIGNYAVNGGAIVSSAKINELKGNFISNTATNVGGAFHNIYNGTVNFIDSSFIGNYAGNEGGAIYSSGENSVVTVTAENKDVYFINNTSGSANNTGIYIKQGTLNLNANGHKIEIDDNMYLGGTKNVNLDNGTLKLGQDSAKNYTFTTMEVSNDSTLDLQNNHAGDNITVTTFTGNEGSDLKFNVDYDATSDAMDKMTITNGSGKITLNAVNVLNDNDTFEDKNNIYLSGNLTNITVISDAIASTVTDSGYIYIFTPTETKGQVSIIRNLAYSGDLINAINNDIESEYIPNAFSLSQDFTADRDMGTLNNTNRESFTIFGNGKSISRGANAGITVNSGDTLNIDSVAGFSGTSDYAINNSGTLNLTGTNSIDKITDSSNNGTTNVTSGSTTVADMTQKTVNISGGALELNNSSNITKTNITGGELNLTGNNLTLTNADIENGTVNLSGTGTNISIADISGGNLNLSGANTNLANANLSGGTMTLANSDAISSVGANTTIVGNGGTLSLVNNSASDVLNFTNAIDNTNSFNLAIDVDLREDALGSDIINADVSGSSPIYLSILNFLNDDAESAQVQIADGGIKSLIQLTNNFDSGIYATASYNSSTGILSLSDKISWITPTLGSESAYKWTRKNNGQIPVTYGNKTFYTDIKPEAQERKNYTWDSSTRQFTNLGTSVNGDGYYINNSSNVIAKTSGTTEYNIIGDFIGNNVGSDYSVIRNHPSNTTSTITSIKGDFIGNTSTYSLGGGAIFNWGNRGTATISRIEGNFINNQAVRGGAISNGAYYGSSSITIIDSNFIGNIATGGNGGAIYSADNGTITITAQNKDVLFENNNSTGTADGTGTGIYINSGTLNLNANNGKKLEINDSMYLGGTSNVTLNTGTLKLGEKAANTTFTNLTVSDASTLDLQNNHAGDAVTFSKLTGSGELKLNLDYDASNNNMDKITVNNGSGAVKLNAVNVTAADENFENETEATYLDGNARANIAVSADKTSTVYDGYIYEFTPDTTTHGLVYVSREKAYMGDLINAIQDNVGTSHPNSFSLSADYTANRDMGTLNNENRAEFTIFGNGKNIVRGDNEGITVSEGDKLNIENVAGFSGTSDYAVNNSGTLTFTGTNSVDRSKVN